MADGTYYIRLGWVMLEAPQAGGCCAHQCAACIVRNTRSLVAFAIVEFLRDAGRLPMLSLVISPMTVDSQKYRYNPAVSYTSGRDSPPTRPGETFQNLMQVRPVRKTRPAKSPAAAEESRARSSHGKRL